MLKDIQLKKLTKDIFTKGRNEKLDIWSECVYLSFLQFFKWDKWSQVNVFGSYLQFFISPKKKSFLPLVNSTNLDQLFLWLEYP